MKTPAKKLSLLAPIDPPFCPQCGGIGDPIDEYQLGLEWWRCRSCRLDFATIKMPQ